mgnify:CR=1 FL=1
MRRHQAILSIFESICMPSRSRSASFSFSFSFSTGSSHRPLVHVDDMIFFAVPKKTFHPMLCFSIVHAFK